MKTHKMSGTWSLLPASLRAQSNGAPMAKKTVHKSLIVYLTRTHNTEAIAKMIQVQTGADLLAIKLKKPYPQDYQANVDQVVAENERGYLPPLASHTDQLADYDVVYVGFPTWDMRLPPPVKSFLNQADLSGKIVLPFNTHAGYGVGSGFDEVRELCPHSTVRDGLSLQGGYERNGLMLAIKGDKARQAEQQVIVWLKAQQIIHETNLDK